MLYYLPIIEGEKRKIHDFISANWNAKSLKILLKQRKKEPIKQVKERKTEAKQIKWKQYLKDRKQVKKKKKNVINENLICLGYFCFFNYYLFYF